MGTSSEGFPHATTQNLNIVIVGASLGGLATALALKRLPPPHHHTITLLERSPTALLHDQGAGIVAGGDTLAFFKRYDKCNRDIAASSASRQYLNKDGEVVHEEAMRQNMTSWDLVYHILRANVDGVKSEYCSVPEEDQNDKTVTHLHGHKVTSLSETSQKLTVHFETHDGKKGAMQADLLIAADGPSSTIRSLLAPDTHRTYAGYVALRGTLAESRASPALLAAFRSRFTFFHGPGVQMLAYLIPGVHGTLSPGQRLINFVYYTNMPAASLDEPSAALRELMTDSDGAYHRVTMPPGKMDARAWARQMQRAREVLPPQFAELVCAAQRPFVQAVTDVVAPTNEFLDGRVVLVGDALAGFRPHTVASTSQACFDAMMLADMIEGKVGRREWKRETLGFARTVQRRGWDMGERSQHQDLPLEEHIKDRNRASLPREEEVWPAWAVGDCEE